MYNDERKSRNDQSDLISEKHAHPSVDKLFQLISPECSPKVTPSFQGAFTANLPL